MEQTTALPDQNRTGTTENGDDGNRSKAIADAEGNFTLPVLLKRFLHIFKDNSYVGVGQVITVSKDKDGACAIVKLIGSATGAPAIELTEYELKKCSRISTQAERNLLLKQAFETSNMITKLTYDNDVYASALASLGSKVWPQCGGFKTMPLPLRARRMIDALNDNPDEIASAISPVIVRAPSTICTPTSSPTKLSLESSPPLKRKSEQTAATLLLSLSQPKLARF